MARIVWILAFAGMTKDDVTPTENRSHADESFWSRGLGVVTPHRAQQALLVKMLEKEFCPNTRRDSSQYKRLILDAVDTVERFQGQPRDVIIASFGVGDRDAIRKEEDFLMNLNRFNVMASRPRAKLIVFLSEELLRHIPESAAIQKQSRFLKAFADVFCNHRKPLTLTAAGKTIAGTWVYHQ